jgi:hypothetical protein
MATQNPPTHEEFPSTTALPSVPPPPPPLPLPPAVPDFPQFWNLLTDSDQMTYISIRQALSSSACKHQRHHSTTINKDIITSLRGFIIRNDRDDWKRSIVCGICWLRDGIAINTRQLSLLVGKCKSSVNAMFQNLGYTTIPSARDYAPSLVEFFPILKDNFAELRKWTIRFSTLEIPPPAQTDHPMLGNIEESTRDSTVRLQEEMKR